MDGRPNRGEERWRRGHVGALYPDSIDKYKRNMKHGPTVYPIHK